MNRELPHLLVLAEDRANEEIANGFFTHSGLALGKIKMLPIAGGGLKAVNAALGYCHKYLSRYQNAHLVLLIDFKEDVEIAAKARARLLDASPLESERVFIVGCQFEPEDLRRALGLSLEKIGYQLAEECLTAPGDCWSHPQLIHNQEELARLRLNVLSFLRTTR